LIREGQEKILRQEERVMEYLSEGARELVMYEG